MRTLLRALMYAVAVVAGVDAYLVGVRLAGEAGMPAGWAQVTAVLVGATVALIVATVPIAVYQRVMRHIVARRRAARLTIPEPVDLAPEPTAAPRRSNQTYGVTARENRALEWPAPTRHPVPNR